MGAMRAVVQPRPDYLTVAEFLEWDSGDGSGRLWQLRDGVPEAMAPAGERHATIHATLGTLIHTHLEQSGRSCRLLVNPGVQPRLRAAINARVPDLAVTCAPPADRRLMIEPVLLIEILSPSNVRETWDNVWSYSTIAGVAEILVVHTQRPRAELLRRQPDGLWPEQPKVIEGEQVLELRSIGLSLPLAAAYRGSGIG
jgi:Uma2 family endonuclease